MATPSLYLTSLEEAKKRGMLTWSAVAESEASLRVQDGDTAFALC